MIQEILDSRLRKLRTERDMNENQLLAAEREMLSFAAEFLTAFRGDPVGISQEFTKAIHQCQGKVKMFNERN